MKNKKNVLLFLLMILPIVMGAEGVSSETLVGIILMEVFCTIHSTFFLLRPLAKLLCPFNMSEKKFFWILFILRIIILTICDMIGYYMIAFIDIASLFVGGFIVIPILGIFGNKIKKAMVDRKMKKEDMYIQMQMFCKKCGTKLDPSLEKCSNCGTPSHIFKGN